MYVLPVDGEVAGVVAEFLGTFHKLFFLALDDSGKRIGVYVPFLRRHLVEVVERGAVAAYLIELVGKILVAALLDEFLDFEFGVQEQTFGKQLSVVSKRIGSWVGMLVGGEGQRVAEKYRMYGPEVGALLCRHRRKILQYVFVGEFVTLVELLRCGSVISDIEVVCGEVVDGACVQRMVFSECLEPDFGGNVFEADGFVVIAVVGIIYGEVAQRRGVVGVVVAVVALVYFHRGGGEPDSFLVVALFGVVNGKVAKRCGVCGVIVAKAVFVDFHCDGHELDRLIFFASL